MSKQRILFLCTGNSCRSQMAEGLLKNLHGDRYEAHSAGTRPQALNPLAIKAMLEIGIDISTHRSKHLDELRGQNFDYVISVCSAAREACPVWQGSAKVLHQGFEDPPALAAAAKTDEERMPHYRRVRDEIRRFIADFPTNLETT